MDALRQYQLFDSHFHIIDPRFTLVPNQGYLPATFTTGDYLAQTSQYNLCGGAIVSGSFQAFDQDYLLQALKELGPGFVGVTQMPATTSDEEILRLDRAGVRAVRFNLKRGGSEGIEQLDRFARRIHELANWHIELYVDSKDLAPLGQCLAALPAVSVDHLGLSAAGLRDLYALVEKGVYIKATGFGRVDFDATEVIQKIVSINPDGLMFGTDLPSTRAPTPYSDDDFRLTIEALGDNLSQMVLFRNAQRFYRFDMV